MKLSVKALALSMGILWGGCLFLWTFLTVLFDMTWGLEMLELFVGFYPWYDITFVGSFVGLVAGFIDGAIGGALLAWLYNKLAK